MIVDIPNFKSVDIKNIVCDFNGTIAKDGVLIPAVGELLPKLSKDFTIYVITADTFKTVEEQLKPYSVKVVVLQTQNHTQEKCDFLRSLDCDSCAAIGNGNNDELMLQEAALSIAVMGFEGCSTNAILKSDLVTKSIEDALSLFLNPKRVVATLRK